MVASANPGSLLIYYGAPFNINHAPSIAAAAGEFANYNEVVLGAHIEDTDPNSFRPSTTQIIQAAPTTRFSGYIDLGVFDSFNNVAMENLPLTSGGGISIQSEIQAWQSMGVSRIFLDDAGYDFQVSRARLNAALDMVHAAGLSAFVNGFEPADLFSATVDPTFNPTGASSTIASGDQYLWESFQVQSGNYVPSDDFSAKAAELALYQAQYGFGVMSVTTPDNAATYTQDHFDYAWYSAALLGHTAVGWGEFHYSADVNLNPDLAPFRPRPVVDLGPAFLSDVIQNGAVYQRQSSSGLLSVDTQADVASIIANLIPVNTTADTIANDGVTSLREAILQANADPGLSAITFAIAGAGVRTISPTSLLPALTGPTLVAGTTQPGYAGAPLIEISGANAGAGDGLALTGGGSSVRGLAINFFFNGNAIAVRSSGNVVAGNRLGTNAAGDAEAFDSGSGVLVTGGNNRIGGSAPGDGNVLSGNGTAGVYLFGAAATGNIVAGNYIGVNAAGNASVGNGAYGILVHNAPGNTIGGTTAAAANVVSGNGNTGICLAGSGSTGNQVVGNLVGTDAAGTASLANGAYGMRLSDAGSNTIGGAAPGAGNVISGNDGTGLYIVGSGNKVLGNFVGTDRTGFSDLGNTAYGIQVAGSGNTIGGSSAGAGNVVSGNGSGIYVSANNNQLLGNLVGTNQAGTGALGNIMHGLLVSGSGNTVGGTAAGAGNVLAGNSFGLYLSGGSNQVLGNLIGTNMTGDATLANGTDGIRVLGSANVIGGTASGAGNLISGNNSVGVYLAGTATGNQVLGNLIGSNKAGNSRLANRSYGIYAAGSANTIGGSTSGAGNLVSGNGTGIYLAGGNNQVRGNLVGTSKTGSAALGNTTYGVLVSATANTIAANTISANPIGVYLGSTASSNQLLGNFIGTDKTGGARLANTTGVQILGDNNTIGGSAAGAGNVISGNNNIGVYVTSSASGNQILGNLVGTTGSGTAVLGNTNYGVLVTGAGNTVGGSAAGAGNVIAGNGSGVYVTASTTVMRGNFIGTDRTAALALGNINYGVYISSANNAVGGTTTGAANTITRNKIGLYIASGSGNAVLTNSISTNTNAQFLLGAGANNSIAAPVLNPIAAATNITVTGTVTGAAGSSVRVEIFASPTSGQAKQFLGFVTVTLGGSGQASFSAGPFAVAHGQFITATKTDASNNTSVLSNARVVP